MRAKHNVSLGLVAWGALCLSACADAEPPEEVIPPSIEAVYAAPETTGLFPYPSDRLTVADPATATGLRVDIGDHNTGDQLFLTLTSTVNAVNRRDGFSTVGGVVVGFTGPIDIRGIQQEPDAEPPVLDPVRDAEEYRTKQAPFLLIDVDEASPEYGQTRGLLPRFWAKAKDEHTLFDEYSLVAQPSAPLLPKTRYLFVVTDALRAGDGGTIGRSPLMDDVISGAEEGAYAADVREGLGVLKEQVGVEADHVVLATSFTTGSVWEVSLAAAEAVRAAPAPEILEDWTVETPLVAPDKRARLRAVFDTNEYRSAAKHKWEIDDTGAPIPDHKEGLEVFLAFSDATESGPRPVVLYAHGLGGDKDGTWGTAERLAEIAPLGAAVIGIDSPEHGSRSDNPGSPVATTFKFFGVDAATGTFDIELARDNFRQMTADQLALVRLVTGALGTLDVLPLGAPDGVPDLDVSKLLYIGHSFGSVQGPAVFGLAPEIRHAVWNVGGAGLMTLLRDSATFALLVNALRPPGVPDGALARFFAVTQAIVDPGDPINYARFGALSAPPGVPDWQPRDMLIQEVVNDNIVPNSTSELLARAAGLPHVDPIATVSGIPTAESPLSKNLSGGATGAICQFDTVNGDEVATHGELIFSPEGQAQYVEFFRSALEDGHATIVPAYP